MLIIQWSLHALIDVVEAFSWTFLETCMAVPPLVLAIIFCTLVDGGSCELALSFRDLRRRAGTRDTSTTIVPVERYSTHCSYMRCYISGGHPPPQLSGQLSSFLRPLFLIFFVVHHRPTCSILSHHEHLIHHCCYGARLRVWRLCRPLVRISPELFSVLCSCANFCPLYLE